MQLKKGGDHETANLISVLWDSNIEKPEHVKRCWHDVAQKAQAVCAGNEGLGVVVISAGVFGNDAIAWDVRLEPYDMMADRSAEISPEAIGALMALLNRD